MVVVRELQSCNANLSGTVTVAPIGGAPGGGGGGGGAKKAKKKREKKAGGGAAPAVDPETGRPLTPEKKIIYKEVIEERVVEGVRTLPTQPYL